MVVIYHFTIVLQVFCVLWHVSFYHWLLLELLSTWTMYCCFPLWPMEIGLYFKVWKTLKLVFCAFDINLQLLIHLFFLVSFISSSLFSCFSLGFFFPFEEIEHFFTLVLWRKWSWRKGFFLYLQKHLFGLRWPSECRSQAPHLYVKNVFILSSFSL